jgi:hypothetical protein
MPAPFRHLTLPQLGVWLDEFPFERRINAIHLHHTWRPNHAGFNGHDSLVAMWKYQTQVKGWTDIAQHLTVAPDGVIWLGRNWNQPPASAAGHNGTRTAGPFMIELVGDFDLGRDSLDGEQRRVALQVIVLVQKRFSLAAESLAFHNQMSARSCPGTSLDPPQIVDQLRKQRPPRTTTDEQPFDQDALVSRADVQAFSREIPARDDRTTLSQMRTR